MFKLGEPKIDVYHVCTRRVKFLYSLYTVGGSIKTAAPIIGAVERITIQIR